MCGRKGTNRRRRCPSPCVGCRRARRRGRATCGSGATTRGTRSGSTTEPRNVMARPAPGVRCGGPRPRAPACSESERSAGRRRATAGRVCVHFHLDFFDLLRPVSVFPDAEAAPSSPGRRALLASARQSHLNSSVASMRARVVFGSHALCPESDTIQSLASGSAFASACADAGGQTTS